MKWLHATWLAITFLFGLAFVFALPPFQSNDETFHWHRLWATAHGQIVCRTMTQSARAFPRVFNTSPALGHKIGDRHFRNAKIYLGTSEKMVAGDTACTYFPTGYVLPAMAARVIGLTLAGEPRGGVTMLAAFYAARIVNWVFLSLMVFWALRRLPRLRTLLLAFYSIPEVLQQGSAINNDAFLFSATLVLLVCLAAQPRFSMVIWIGLAAVGMTLTKPIYAGVALLMLPVLLALPRRPRDLAALVLMIAPLPLWLLWQRFNTYDRSIDWKPSWHVDAREQLQFLKDHPLHLLSLMWAQLKDTFGVDLMHGNWRSILGAFGWSACEMPRLGYYLVLAAIGVAAVRDVHFDPEPRASIAGRAPRWSWVVALLGVASVIPACIMGMYLLFTAVGSPSVNGVQGRYYLIPLLLLAGGGILLSRSRLPRGPLWVGDVLIAVPLVLTAVANGMAIQAIRAFFYEAS